MSSEVASHAPRIENRAALAKLTLAALGIVYGDIGTSPLYAIRECFTLPHGVEVTRVNVLGVESLVFWSLVLVIVLKYLSFIMRADNHGEGGMLSLLALLKAKPGAAWSMAVYVALGLFGTALLYGDSVITPAISVLGAMEGLQTTSTFFTTPIILTISIVILFALFFAQRFGTARVGAVFGPVILVWFSTIGALGITWIVKRPEVLLAINPTYAIEFFTHHQTHGFLMLGFVVLCVTGGEALYADMGHFGRTPIQIGWFFVAFPALVLNYLGQGALLLARGPVSNPFFEMASGPWRYGLIAIATLAAIIAAQAMISGSFSLTQQAVQLGYWPRVTIKHTSGNAAGQIYVPSINSALLVGCIALVLVFQDSSRLASAYGIAVTGTMTITSILFFGVLRRRGWSTPAASALVAWFLLFDLAFLSANVHKIADGGWFPVAIGVAMFTLMTTWHRGRALLARATKRMVQPMDSFLAELAATPPQRVNGTAVFMTSTPDGVPLVLRHSVRHMKVLHEQVLMLSIRTLQVPTVTRAERIEPIEDLGQGLYRIRARYGFMETPNVIELMDLCAEQGLETRDTSTSYFLGRETLIMTKNPGLSRWRKRLFALMSRNARPANAFFRIPPNHVVELGAQIEL